MIRINDNFEKLSRNYLFTEVARRVNEYISRHPHADVIRMGIGDVTIPVAESALKAMHKAVDDEGTTTHFYGYGPEMGYDFLRNAISEHDYRSRGVEIGPNEIFISDGAKSDLGNIGDILSTDCVVGVTDPVYPVYVDTNIMGGRKIEFIPCTADNDFIPTVPPGKIDVIYLCSPNNPTGTALNRSQLTQWVDYAREHGSLILFDSAYEAFITEEDIPHSIYEIPGAHEVAIEFRSFSKTAGFTGIRCGYTVVPHSLKGIDSEGKPVSLRELWNRRQCTKFNGASYIAQRGAEALYTPEGRQEVKDTIRRYLDTAATMRSALEKGGFKVWGGVNSPYLWTKNRESLTSWEMFDMLLHEYNIVCTPGSGFGACGEGYVRFTAFNVARAAEAAERLTHAK